MVKENIISSFIKWFFVFAIGFMWIFDARWFRVGTGRSDSIYSAWKSRWVHGHRWFFSDLPAYNMISTALARLFSFVKQPDSARQMLGLKQWQDLNWGSLVMQGIGGESAERQGLTALYREQNKILRQLGMDNVPQTRSKSRPVNVNVDLEEEPSKSRRRQNQGDKEDLHASDDNIQLPTMGGDDSQTSTEQARQAEFRAQQQDAGSGEIEEQDEEEALLKPKDAPNSYQIEFRKFNGFDNDFRIENIELNENQQRPLIKVGAVKSKIYNENAETLSAAGITNTTHFKLEVQGGGSDPVTLEDGSKLYAIWRMTDRQKVGDDDTKGKISVYFTKL